MSGIQSTTTISKQVHQTKKNLNLRKKIIKKWRLYVMIAPAIIFFAIFNYYPMYGVIIAFKDYVATQGILGSPWVGFKHFERFFNAYYFWQLLKNTFLIVNSKRLYKRLHTPRTLYLLL